MPNLYDLISAALAWIALTVSTNNLCQITLAETSKGHFRGTKLTFIYILISGIVIHDEFFIY